MAHVNWEWPHPHFSHVRCSAWNRPALEASYQVEILCFSCTFQFSFSHTPIPHTAMLRSVLSRFHAAGAVRFLARPALPGCQATLSTSTPLGYEYILTETVGEKQNVALIKLNRYKALNALCDGLMTELGGAMGEFDKDPQVCTCVV